MNAIKVERRQIYLFVEIFAAVVVVATFIIVRTSTFLKGDIPETARLHNAPQQCDAMTLLSGNARNAANKS